MRIPRWLRWRSNAELDQEIEAHLELEIRANLDRGLSPDEARFAAMRRFGNATLVKDRARESAGRAVFAVKICHSPPCGKRVP